MPAQPKYMQPSQSFTTLQSDVRNANTNKQVRTVGDRQKQWSLCLAIVFNTTPIVVANGGVQQIGWDTQNINTFQSLGQPKYNLTFTSAVLNGHTYPYTGIILPQTGLYDLNFSGTISNAGTGAQMVTDAIIRLNGATIVQNISNQNGAGGLGLNTSQAIRPFLCQAGDTLTTFFFQINSAGANPNFYQGDSSASFFAIRYMGEG